MENVIEIKVEDYLKSDFPIFNHPVSEDDKNSYLDSIGFVQNPKGGYTFCCNTFSRFFIRYVSLILLPNEEDFAIYNYRKGLYELKCMRKICKLIKYTMNLVVDLWNPSFENMALRTIKTDVAKVALTLNHGDYINLLDGVLDLKSFEIKPHSPEYVSTVQLPFEYNNCLATPCFNKYLDDITCGDKDLQLVLQEMAGYCLCNSTSAEKAFFLVGNGCNGKSVFAKILQNLVGEGNYANTNLTALGGSFGLASLINANVNIAAENSGAKISSEIFKALVSGDTVEINRKYRDALSVALHVKLVLLFNSLPDSDDLTYGFFRKIIIIPFKRTFKSNEIDVELPAKLEKELSGIFHWSIEGLKRLQQNSYVFTFCRACEIELEKYKKSLNPVSEFFDEVFCFDPHSKIKRTAVYQNYVRFCTENAYEILNCQKFWRLLKAHFTDKGEKFTTCKIKGYEYVKSINYIK